MAWPAAEHKLTDGVLTAAGAAMLLAGLTLAAGSGALLAGGGLIVAGAAAGLPALRRLVPAGTLTARRGLPATILSRGLLTFAFFGADAYVTLSITAVRQHSPVVAGVAVTGATLAWTAGAWVQARLSEKWEGRRLIRAGLVIVLAGIAGMVLMLQPGVPVAVGLAAWTVAGLGMGLAYSPISLLMLREAPAGREGWASASLNLTDVLGTAIGIGAGGAAVAAGATLRAGVTAAFGIAAAMALVALAVSRRLPAGRLARPSPPSPNQCPREASRPGASARRAAAPPPRRRTAAPLASAPDRWQGSQMSGGEERDGVKLTNLDQPLFEGAQAAKRDLVDYLDAVSDRIIPALRDRPLSVIRVLRGQQPFMQKNVPKYTPDFVATVQVWADASKREVSYALCNDRRTLLWLANQRAVEYHPTLARVGRMDHPTHLVLDIDPPAGGPFGLAVRAARLVRQVLAEAGLSGAVKTSGAKGVHVFVPVDQAAAAEDIAAATRAIAARAERLDPALATTAFIREDREGKVFLDSTRAGGATVVAVYSPRVRPGVPVSFPVPWEDLDRVAPADFTVRTAARLAGRADPWAGLMPAPQQLGGDLIEEGRAIPVARVQAMHEGKRRARARRGG